MHSSLRERFERLGPIRALDHVAGGSPATFVLRLSQGRPISRPIDGIIALARRGVTMLQAKRTVETLIADGRVSITLPTVDDAQVLAADLAHAGIAAVPIETPEAADVIPSGVAG